MSTERINNSNALKALETKLNERNSRRSELIKLVEQYQGELSRTKKEIDQINQQIYNLKNQNKDVIISEHALLRFIERIVGIDMEEIRGRILDDKTKNQLLTLGNCRYNKDGMTLVVKDNTIVTIETKEK